MSSINNVTLLGRMTRDPESRSLQSGTKVANFSLAMNRKWKDSGGTMQEEVVFVEIEAWARQAEVVCEYAGKGDLLGVEGRLKLDQWEDKNSGEKRSRLKVVAERITLMPKGDKGGGNGGNGGGGNRSNNSGRSQQRQQDEYDGGGNDDSGGDGGNDIPF